MLTPLQEDTRSQVGAAAIQYGVPPELAQAVNYIESRYGANTGPSSAGAYGEMQITNNKGPNGEPGTADLIARDHNNQYGTKWTAQDILDDSDTNIKAGVFYLKQGLDRFNGDESKALFRYNPSSQYVKDVQEQRTIESQQGIMSRVGNKMAQSDVQAQPFQPLVQQSSVLNTPFTLPQRGEPGYQSPGEQYSTPGQEEFLTKMQQGQLQSQRSEQRYKEASLARAANIDVDDGIPTAAKWMTVIAALMGNMQPMIQLKLKSNENILTAKAQPLLKEAMQLEAEGERDKSFELLQQAQSIFGSKVPALGQQINARLDQVRADRLSYNQAKAQVDIWLKSTPPDDVRYKRIQSLRIGLAANLPGVPEAVKQFAAVSGIQRQYYPAANMESIQSQETGERAFQPVPVAVTPATIDSYAIKQIAADNQRTPQDVVNALNNPQHPMNEQFKQQYAQHSGVENNFNIQSRIQGTPENIAMLQVLQRRGDSNPQLTLSQGIKDPSVTAEGIQQQRFNITQLAKAPIEAVQQTTRLEQGGQVALSYDPESTNRLSYQRHGTPDDAMKSGKVIFDANSPVLRETQLASDATVAYNNFRKDYDAIPNKDKGAGTAWENFTNAITRLTHEQRIGGRIPFGGSDIRFPVGPMTPQMEQALSSYNILAITANSLSAIGAHDSTAVQSMLDRIYGSITTNPTTSSIHLRTYGEWLDRKIQQNLQQGGRQEIRGLPPTPDLKPSEQPKKRIMVPVPK